MTRILAPLAVVLLFVARTASAQAAWTAPVYNWGSGWCPTCYVLANVDTPNLATPWQGTISGWAFNCESGASVDKIDVYYTDATASRRADSYILALNQPRPDVSAYFRSWCPKMNETTGWTVAFKTPIPSGTWRISVVFWKGLISTTQTGLVVVP
jgi:hypothetical protein